MGMLFHLLSAFAMSVLAMVTNRVRHPKPWPNGQSLCGSSTFVISLTLNCRRPGKIS